MLAVVGAWTLRYRKACARAFRMAWLVCALLGACAGNARRLSFAVPPGVEELALDLATEAEAIDLGDARLFVRGYLGWEGEERFSGSVEVHVLDSEFAPMQSLELPPVDRAEALREERRGLSIRRGWAFDQVVLRLPPGTRTLRVESHGLADGIEVFLVTDAWRRRMPLVSNSNSWRGLR